MTYVQCLLQRNGQEMVSWVPKQGIQEGTFVILKDVEGLWRIKEMYSTTPHEQL